MHNQACSIRSIEHSTLNHLTIHASNASKFCVSQNHASPSFLGSLRLSKLVIEGSVTVATSPRKQVETEHGMCWLIYRTSGRGLGVDLRLLGKKGTFATVDFRVPVETPNSRGKRGWHLHQLRRTSRRSLPEYKGRFSGNPPLLSKTMGRRVLMAFF